MTIACAGVLVQCFWTAKSRPGAVYQCCHLIRAHWHMDTVAVALAIATSLCFASNSLLVLEVLALVKAEPLRAVWQQCYLFALPYYLLGGMVVAVMALPAGSRDGSCRCCFCRSWAWHFCFIEYSSPARRCGLYPCRRNNSRKCGGHPILRGRGVTGCGGSCLIGVHPRASAAKLLFVATASGLR
jgi:hypothetical protein